MFNLKNAVLLMDFSTYLMAYNLMGYYQDYNEQSIYKIDCLYLEDNKSVNYITQKLCRS